VLPDAPEADPLAAVPDAPLVVPEVAPLAVAVPDEPLAAPDELAVPDEPLAAVAPLLPLTVDPLPAPEVSPEAPLTPLEPSV
jgi:hypothetical protein